MMPRTGIAPTPVLVDTQALAAAGSSDLQASQDDDFLAVPASALWRRGCHVVLGLPGAFCLPPGSSFLQDYKRQASLFTALGVQALWCVAVNDPYVMRAWLAQEQVQGQIHAVADGSAQFTRAMGLELCLHDLGMGTRSRWYAMLVKDGAILHLAIEPPGQLMVSGAAYMAQTVQAYLR